MKHLLPPLPYEMHALEPVISAETLALHHGKHHRAYVDKLNTALAQFPIYQSMGVNDLLRRLDSLDPRARGEIRKHGGGHANHSLFWLTMSRGGHAPSSKLTAIIERQFQSLEGLRAAFAKCLANVFGSGWVFLNLDTVTGALEVLPLPNQDSPLSSGGTPLLAFDAWEHAYYLQYHQDREQWLRSWWTTINWKAVECQFDKAKNGELT